MLALMPQAPPLPLDRPASLASGAMSVAILPSSPVTYGQHTMPVSAVNSTSPSKRPKLSLNTATVPATFGKGSTSLRLETLSAASPTSRNTFKNTYSPQAWQVSNASTLTLSPRSLDAPESEDHASLSQADDSDYSDLAESVASSVSTVSASTVESSLDDVPYQLPSNIRSILSNGPVPRVRYRRPSKKMFPARKAVAFRTPLTEDIKTYRFTLSNIDFEALPSAEDLSVLKPQSMAAATTTHSTLDADADADDDALCPATPVAGKRKRDRQWVWTLGPSASNEG